MEISYSLPLSKGWYRMKKALFKPFDLNKWMRIGFTAFLAGLVDCNGGNTGGRYNKGHFDWHEFFRFPETAWEWLNSHPLWFTLIIIGLVLVFLIVTILIWLSSRGKFMFLDNVATDSSGISKPWGDYHRQGNSLFVWRFLYGWLVFMLFAGFFVFCFNRASDLFYGDYSNLQLFWNITGMVLFFFGLLILVSYVSLFLDDFVVAIMYKHKIGVLQGWKVFLSLFGRHAGTFIVYGLFILILKIATAIIVIFAALLTCCIGLVLLVIPYIGAVVLLPVSYTFRALSAEFLAQFGEEYSVFPKPEEPREEILIT